jgi:aspartate/methionine/tyrosine aminotransferase
LLLALGVLVNPGDEWLLPDPGYPCNRHFVRMLEGRRFHSRRQPPNYQPTATQVRPHGPADQGLMLVASPANPTGTLLDRRSLASLADVVAAQRHLLVDEIYHGLTYGVDAMSALAISDDISSSTASPSTSA